MKKIQIFEEERKQAIATLVSLGVAKYVKDMDLYHGRAGNGDDDWVVIPCGNAMISKNKKFNSGVLSVASENLAKIFADVRALENNLKAEVYKIVSYDYDAIVFDLAFDVSMLSNECIKKYYDAMFVLNKFDITQSNPIRFEYKESYNVIMSKFKEYQKKCNCSCLSNSLIEVIINELICDDVIKNIFNDIDEFKRFIYGLVGAYNAREFLKTQSGLVLGQYLKGEKTLELENLQNKYVIDLNFISAWCSANHIVGVCKNEYVDKISQEIGVCYFFDTKKIMSEKQRNQMYAKMFKNYGEIAKSLGAIVDVELEELFKKGSAKEILNYMKQHNECAKLYNMDCYIWEGWNIGQHTQSVIDFFDSYYTEEVPCQLRPFIKLCMLVHDIGKSYACASNRPQHEMNVKYSKVVFDALNIALAYRKLINFIISDSQNFTSSILLNRGDKQELLSQLKYACKQSFFSSFDRYPSENELQGLINICIILQECDSGAYTRYAQIQEGEKMVGGGGDGFTASFKLNSRGEPRLKRFYND